KRDGQSQEENMKEQRTTEKNKSLIRMSQPLMRRMPEAIVATIHTLTLDCNLLIPIYDVQKALAHNFKITGNIISSQLLGLINALGSRVHKLFVSFGNLWITYPLVTYNGSVDRMVLH
ncbi:15597_t:CDS:2, partial [Acaulospora morrowiae]